MTVWRRYLGQGVAYAAFVAVVGYLASGPAYQHLAPELATIKLSLRHAGALVADCRDRTAAELQSLPPNMRAPQICPRERSPLTLVLLLDDEPVYSEVLPPPGLHKDGRASVYRRLSVPVGEVRISVKLKDDVRTAGFQFEHSARVNLLPAQVLVIDFDEQAGAFVIRGDAATPVARPAARVG
ncbi:MAG: hypothetical protein HC809_06760 [Gammaproteobacteria bacterium]|nr:hypothetical protein [Gammaproteobacteria bacterium]